VGSHRNTQRQMTIEITGHVAECHVSITTSDRQELEAVMENLVGLGEFWGGSFGFFGGFGVFFVGVGFLWWVSLQAKRR
jgi:hypothetical protein